MLETAAGTRVVIDPIPKGLGYELPSNLRADLVTISHEHADHNNVALVAGKPRVIRGLTSDRKGWTRVDEKVKDVSVRAVAVYHDDKRGAVRGLNTVFIFEVGGLRIAHLGDLGNTLTDDQLAGDRPGRRVADPRRRHVHHRRPGRRRASSSSCARA